VIARRHLLYMGLKIGENSALSKRKARTFPLAHLACFGHRGGHIRFACHRSKRGGHEPVPGQPNKRLGCGIEFRRTHHESVDLEHVNFHPDPQLPREAVTRPRRRATCGGGADGHHSAEVFRSQSLHLPHTSKFYDVMMDPVCFEPRLTSKQAAVTLLPPSPDQG
jgi:hypothetical protein